MTARVFTVDQMKKIARYEETFGFEEKHISLDQLRAQFAEYSFPEPYQMTLEDLQAALGNIQHKNPTVYDAIFAWWYPIYHLAPFGVLQASGFDEQTKKERTDRVRGLIVDECDVFYRVWTLIGGMPQKDYHTAIALEEDLAIAMEIIRWYLEEKDKPVTERSFSYWDKLGFLKKYEKKEWLAAANDRELAICRTFCEELAADGNETALALTAEACRKGNRLYDKDVNVAYACYMTLWETTHSPAYARELGKFARDGIGMAEGQPDIALAVKFLTIGTIYGDHESMNELAELLVDGNGTLQSPETAHELHRRVYEDERAAFVAGEKDTHFIAAANQMSRDYQDGVGVDADNKEAYRYQVEAYAATKATGGQDAQFSARRDLLAVQNKLPDGYRRDGLDRKHPEMFRLFASGGAYAEVTVTQEKENRYIIKLARKSLDGGKPMPMLITEPRFGTSVMQSEIVIGGRIGQTDLVGKGAVAYDHVKWTKGIDTPDRLIFYRVGKAVGWVEFERYRFPAPGKEM
ncbi:MAG: hypothetical protein MR711_05015 [Selenomonas sp.]|uniref:hypothetical protein n=1 Tax=Selenomonas sp. TaxID=2053611 RepID=UPI0025FC2C05|nr:hypothetical protein [Selenomonas sp.]MCI6085599.1 hypothetical protein [Selenomonas sp.]